MSPQDSSCRDVLKTLYAFSLSDSGAIMLVPPQKIAFLGPHHASFLHQLNFSRGVLEIGPHVFCSTPFYYTLPLFHIPYISYIISAHLNLRFVAYTKFRHRSIKKKGNIDRCVFHLIEVTAIITTQAQLSYPRNPRA